MASEVSNGASQGGRPRRSRNTWFPRVHFYEINDQSWCVLSFFLPFCTPYVLDMRTTRIDGTC